MSGHSQTGISLRVANRDDMQILFDWQTTPGMRKYFKNPNPPDWNTHQTWFDNRVRQEDPGLWIIEYSNQRVGMLRIDKKIHPVTGHEVSILLDQGCRGAGIARMALKLLRQTMPGVIFLAQIHPNNIASVKLFEAAGYTHFLESYYVCKP